MKNKLVKYLRTHQTDAEIKLWNILRANKVDGFKFKRQVALGKYIVDFISFTAKLIIEADGSQHEGSEADRISDRYFTERGYRTLRFLDNEILSNLDGVISEIYDCLKDSPSPLPPPRRGEGELK